MTRHALTAIPAVTAASLTVMCMPKRCCRKYCASRAIIATTNAKRSTAITRLATLRSG